MMAAFGKKWLLFRQMELFGVYSVQELRLAADRQR
jgi:hypothetical protein